MIKARMGNVVFVGLSRGNVERLLQDMPIRFDGMEVGIPGILFVIMGGETEPDIMKQFSDAGLIGPETKIDDRFTGRGNH